MVIPLLIAAEAVTEGISRQIVPYFVISTHGHDLLAHRQVW
jgi:hypothetical protein